MDGITAAFSEQAENLTRSANAAAGRVSHGGEALRAQAESLSATVNRMTSRLDAMRQTGDDQAKALQDAASTAAAEGRRALRHPIQIKTAPPAGRSQPSAVRSAAVPTPSPAPRPPRPVPARAGTT